MAPMENEFLPYEMVSPGFEAVYTGEKREAVAEDTDPAARALAL